MFKLTLTQLSFDPHMTLTLTHSDLDTCMQKMKSLCEDDSKVIA